MTFSTTRGARQPQGKKARVCVCWCASVSQNGGAEDANTHLREICTQETLRDFNAGSGSQLCRSEIVCGKLRAKAGIYGAAQQKRNVAVRV